MVCGILFTLFCRFNTLYSFGNIICRMLERQKAVFAVDCIFRSLFCFSVLNLEFKHSFCYKIYFLLFDLVYR